MFPTSPAQPALSYASRFYRYSQRTNGKLLLAKAIEKNLGSEKLGSILDLGTGDGQLLGTLAHRFHQIIAVEKNAEFVEDLKSRCPAFQVIHGRMEGKIPAQLFDVILLSYSATGVAEASWPGFLGELSNARKDQGRLLMCTYDDTGPYAEFAYKVSALLGTPLQGTLKDYIGRIRNADYEVDVIETVETEIWDDTLEELYQLIAFFFQKHIDGYLANQNSIIELLKKHSGGSTSRASIKVKEVILEVDPRHRRRNSR